MLKALHDTIFHYDHLVWYYLNTRWHNGVMDEIIPYFRNPLFWAPLYLFLAIYIPKKFGKAGLLWCLLFIITFALSDQVSASLLKPLFGRIRPCNDPAFAGIVHIIVPCGGGKSFPSSHAANHFSLAVFSAISLGHLARWMWPAWLAWAVLVSYSQVYVGVHFPLDVFCGGLLGAFIGWITGKVFNSRYKLA